MENQEMKTRKNLIIGIIIGAVIVCTVIWIFQATAGNRQVADPDANVSTVEKQNDRDDAKETISAGLEKAGEAVRESAAEGRGAADTVGRSLEKASEAVEESVNQ